MWPPELEDGWQKREAETGKSGREEVERRDDEEAESLRGG